MRIYIDDKVVAASAHFSIARACACVCVNAQMSLPCCQSGWATCLSAPHDSTPSPLPYVQSPTALKMAVDAALKEVRAGASLHILWPHCHAACSQRTCAFLQAKPPAGDASLPAYVDMLLEPLMPSLQDSALCRAAGGQDVAAALRLLCTSDSKARQALALLHALRKPAVQEALLQDWAPAMGRRYELQVLADDVPEVRLALDLLWRNTAMCYTQANKAWHVAMLPCCQPGERLH